jgi:hypothetical protein
MFRSLPDHHQGVHDFLVKVTELNCEYSCVVMLPQLGRAKILNGGMDLNWATLKS